MNEATQATRRAKPELGTWRWSWLGAVGCGLALVVLAATLVQARQFTLLRSSGQASDDFIVLMVHQNESEYLRLRDAWRRAAEDTDELEAESLRLRYQIWVSRFEPLLGEPAQKLLQAVPDRDQTLRAMQAFIQRADVSLGRAAVLPATPVTREVIAELWPALRALDSAIHRLSVDAARHVAAQAEQRGQTVRTQGLLSLALTGSLALLALAFGLLAVAQLRRARERRLALEQLAAELRQSQREAQAASNAKSAFLANMSHEIRTPFHGLMGMLSLLRETGLNERQIDFLRTATESADHLLAILNDILDMSQLEAGHMSLAPRPTELRHLLREVEALMRPQAHAKALSLHIDADPAVPERVLLDATRVKQVLFNLLSNAIKFSDHGTVVLDVRVSQLTGSGQPLSPMLDFVITDTGAGMDAATLARLFNRYGQGDGSTSRRQGGTGLGLEISRNLARLMRGDISVRSKPGEGSAFCFSLPLSSVPNVAAGADPGARGMLPQHRPLQVLVAEDHPVNRQYLAALLENLGHEAHFTANGEQAVQAAREGHFDVVLMDLHMPVLDGIGATRAIRALPDRAAAAVPIVALTADAFEQTRDRCLMAGMNDFLSKPVSPQKLATSLRRLFGSNGGPMTASANEAPRPPALPTLGQPVIDSAALQMALQAMPRERLAQMIAAFLDQGPQTVQRLRAAVRDAQLLELRVNAHAAKGAALNLGLAGLAATAAALQEGAAHLAAHEIVRLVQRYEDLLPLTRQAVADADLAVPEAPAASDALR